MIVDDSSFMRKKIAQVVRAGGHEVVGQAKDGLEGYNLYRNLSPEVVIMDITMRGMDGISSAGMIRGYDPGARIIFMSLITDPLVLEQAEELEAEGILGKNEYDRLMTLIDRKSEARNESA